MCKALQILTVRQEFAEITKKCSVSILTCSSFVSSVCGFLLVGKDIFLRKSEKKCRRQGCFLLGWENETSRCIRTSPGVLLQNPPCAVLLLDALFTCLGYPSPRLLLSFCSPSFSPKQQAASSTLLPMQGKDCYSQTCSCMKILVAILKITTGIDYTSLLYYFTSTLYSLLRGFI